MSSQTDHFFDHAPDMLCICSANGEIRRLNLAWTRVLGYPPDALAGSSWVQLAQLVREEDRKPLLDWLARLKVEVHPIQYCDVRLLDSRQNLLCFRLNATYVRELDLFYLAARDVTALKELERQIMQSEKMAALGQVAAGIAHEISHPLATLTLRLENLNEANRSGREITGAPFAKELEKLIAATERIAKVVKSLKSFTRESSEDPLYPCRVIDLFNDLREICLPQLKAQRVDLRLKPPAGHITIEARPSQILQILINLVTNAAQAIQGVDEKWIEISTREVESLVEIYIADSGPGVPPELRVKLFQSFFTTKSVGHGTGLGLCISRRIAEDHRGTLELLDDSPTTCFVLKLPRRNPNEITAA